MLTADKHNKTFGFIWQFSASLRRQRSLRKDRNGSKHARLMLAHARRKLKARDLKLAVHGSTSMIIPTQGCKLIEPGSGLHFSGSCKLSDWPFCVCATALKSSVCSEITKHFWYKCHSTVKSCLTFRSIH